MMTVLSVIHVTVCFLLIALVLLQDPKNSGGGMFGGGGSNSLLGATGAVTFLTRLTRYSAIIFGITCITMTWLLSRANSGSVFDSVTLPAPPPPTSAPATAPGAAPGTTAGSAPVNGVAPGSQPQPAPGNPPAAATEPSAGRAKEAAPTGTK